MRLILLVTGIILLSACGQNDKTPPPDPTVDSKNDNSGETQSRVPEDNVFHSQVAALEKAEQAAKQQQQHNDKMQKAIQEATGENDNPPR